ncbi:MAG: heme-binding protein [Dehalococcoidia bacterium]
MSITLAEAEKVVQAGKAEAEKMGVGVSISVVDPRGDLKAAVRMDGVGWFTSDVARAKAFASANFGVPSGDLTDRADMPVFRSLVAMQRGHLVLGQGAIPITRGEEVIGAVGVSGATAQEDEDVAKAAARAI